MKRYELTQSDTAKLQKTPGKLSERLVAENYSGYSQFNVDDFDVADGGKLGEVKSTATKLSGGQAGRFRLWKEQHQRLVRYDREHVGRYIFVLYDVSERPVVARMKEKVPAAIGRTIAARGGFYDSGHESKGEQYKLPIDAVFG